MHIVVNENRSQTRAEPTYLFVQLAQESTALGDPVVLRLVRGQVHRHDKIGRMTWGGKNIEFQIRNQNKYKFTSKQIHKIILDGNSFNDLIIGPMAL